MQNLPNSLIKSVNCSDTEALDFMLGTGLDIRMLKLIGKIWNDTDAIERYIQFGGVLVLDDFYYIFMYVTESQKFMHIISLFSPALFEDSQIYHPAYHGVRGEYLSEKSFKNLIVKIVANHNLTNTISVLNFMFEFFNKDQFDNDEPLFLKDFVFYCFLKHNIPVVKDLILFIISKFNIDISNLILSHIVDFYSYTPNYKAVPWNFQLWSETELISVLELLNLQPDTPIVCDSLFYLPLAAIEYYQKIGFNYENAELKLNRVPDYNINIKFPIIKYLHEIGVNFTSETNAQLINYYCEDQVKWFIEVICKSERELIRRHKTLFENKRLVIKSYLWIKLKTDYFSD
jgi:hypothetical protein